MPRVADEHIPNSNPGDELEIDIPTKRKRQVALPSSLYLRNGCLGGSGGSRGLRAHRSSGFRAHGGGGFGAGGTHARGYGGGSGGHLGAIHDRGSGDYHSTGRISSGGSRSGRGTGIAATSQNIQQASGGHRQKRLFHNKLHLVGKFSRMRQPGGPTINRWPVGSFGRSGRIGASHSQVQGYVLFFEENSAYFLCPTSIGCYKKSRRSSFSKGSARKLQDLETVSVRPQV